MIVYFLTLIQVAMASSNPSVVFKNNSAVNSYNQEKLVESKTELEKLAVNNPKEASLHFNLGVVNEESKDLEKAISEYQASIRVAEDEEVRFKANFNLARLYGEKKDTINALKHYQAALDIKPDSEEVKTNIELLFQNQGGGGDDSNEQQQSNQPDEQNQEGQQQAQQPQNQNQGQGKKPQAPQQFKSQDLSQQDVRRILEELKRQEEQIRAKMNNQRSKETPVDKDW